MIPRAHYEPSMADQWADDKGEQYECCECGEWIMRDEAADSDWYIDGDVATCPACLIADARGIFL